MTYAALEPSVRQKVLDRWLYLRLFESGLTERGWRMHRAEQRLLLYMAGLS